MTVAPATGPELCLSTTLERVALAMQVLGNMIVAVETSILENVQEGGPGAAVPLPVQKLDHALQMIDELGVMVQGLAECQLPDAQRHLDEVIARIRLEGLRNLIAHGELQAEQNPEKGKAGHVSLF